jgi:hypothetical protein
VPFWNVAEPASAGAPMSASFCGAGSDVVADGVVIDVCENTAVVDADAL